MLVRPARVAHEAHALTEVWLAAVKATHHFLGPDDIAYYHDRVANDYLSELDVLVAVDGHDRPLGFIGTDEHRVEMLFVHPDHHGRGIGTALLDAVPADHAQVEVDVNEQNPDALAFYIARGFTRVGRSPVDGDGRPFPILHLRRG